MKNRDKNNSAINRAMNRLQQAHEIKKEQHQKTKDTAAQGALSPSLLNSITLPLAQVENILKASQKTFRVVTEEFQTKMTNDPWAILRKVAIGSFILGLVLGRYSRLGKTKGTR